MPSPAEPTARLFPKGIATSVRFRLVFWLFVLTAVAYLDRTDISIAGVHIRRQFGIDNTQLGWLMSAFLLGYATFQIPAGLLARRIGTRRLLTLAVLCWAFFSALTALVPSGAYRVVLTLVMVRFYLGGAEAMLFPASSQIVERWFPVEERGRTNGTIFAGIGIGSGVTPPLVTEIILHFSWRAASGSAPWWRSLSQRCGTFLPVIHRRSTRPFARLS
jgi:ACS family glucarate transporter-like MFS transporter